MDIENVEVLQEEMDEISDGEYRRELKRARKETRKAWKTF
jgi:hypothetical protein